MKKFAKIALNRKIEEVVEIEVEYKIDEEVKKLNKTAKLSRRLLGNRGSLRSHSGNLRKCMKFKEYIYYGPHFD